MDQMTWKWKNCGFPNSGYVEDKSREEGQNKNNQGFCVDEDFSANLHGHEHYNDLSNNCDPKVRIHLFNCKINYLMPVCELFAFVFLFLGGFYSTNSFL